MGQEKINGNDSAFTGEQWGDGYGNLRGPLTKRELFAKDFMAALISKYGAMGPELHAEQATILADALIKKLNETE